MTLPELSAASAAEGRLFSTNTDNKSLGESDPAWRKPVVPGSGAVPHARSSPPAPTSARRRGAPRSEFARPSPPATEPRGLASRCRQAAAAAVHPPLQHPKEVCIYVSTPPVVAQSRHCHPRPPSKGHHARLHLYGRTGLPQPARCAFCIHALRCCNHHGYQRPPLFATSRTCSQISFVQLSNSVSPCPLIGRPGAAVVSADDDGCLRVLLCPAIKHADLFSMVLCHLPAPLWRRRRRQRTCGRGNCPSWAIV